jgi:hypothetical protein
MNKNNDAASLLAGAVEGGDLSSDSQSLLDPMTSLINAGLSSDAPAKADRVTLVTILVDNTPSMGYKNPDRKVNPKGVTNKQLLMEGANAVWDALKKSGVAHTIRVHVAFLNPFDGNNGVHFNFRKLESAVPLTDANYKLVGMTPLRDGVVRVLGTVQAEAQKYLQANSEVFAMTLILSDGDDNNSNASNDDCVTINTDLARQERHHVYLAGFDVEGGSGDKVDWKKVGTDMGIPHVKELPNDPQEIRAWLQLWSQAAVSGSQSADVSDAMQKATSAMGTGGVRL